MLATPKMPQAGELERFGKFLGYNQYNPVYRYQDCNYEVVDSYSGPKGTGKQILTVEPYKRAVGRLVPSYNPFTGEPNQTRRGRSSHGSARY